MKLLTLVLCLTGILAHAKRPNVLFILTDDQAPHTLSVYGNKVCQTPHLDKLAASGMVLDQAYHMGSMSGAVCSPSRTMIMSGRTLWHLPPRGKKHLKKEEGKTSGPEILKNSLPAVFNRAGYETFRTCKNGNSYSLANALFQVVRDKTARKAGEGERVGHHRTDRGAGLVVWVLRGISRRDIKGKTKGGEAMDLIGPNVALFLGARVVAFRGAVFGGYALSPPAPGWRSAARARTWAPGRRAHRWAWRGRLVSCALAARASTRACAPRRASVAGFQRGSPPRRGARAAGGSSRGRPAGAYR